MPRTSSQLSLRPTLSLEKNWICACTISLFEIITNVTQMRNVAGPGGQQTFRILFFETERRQGSILVTTSLGRGQRKTYGRFCQWN